MITTGAHNWVINIEKICISISDSLWKVKMKNWVWNQFQELFVYTQKKCILLIAENIKFKIKVYTLYIVTDICLPLH